MQSSFRQSQVLRFKRQDLLTVRYPCLVPKASTATVSVKYETKMGQSVKLVGTNCNWDASSPETEMTWGEGHVWSRTLTGAENSIVEFKLVVTGSNGSAQWENGDNRVVAFPASPLPSPIQVTCTFGNTKAMEVLVPEVATPPAEEITAKGAVAASKAEATATLAQAEKLVEDLAAVKEEILKKMEEVEKDVPPPLALGSVDIDALEAALSKAEASSAPEIPGNPPTLADSVGVPASLVFAALALCGGVFFFQGYLNSSSSDISDMPTMVSAFSDLGSTLSSKLVAVVNDQVAVLAPSADNLKV